MPNSRPSAPARDPLDAPGDRAAIAEAIRTWFAGAARDLPWRRPSGPTDAARRDPYHALVSEFMLQQTQVARVLERFPAFVARFPTVRDLAAADEAEVLALWSGLGYYRRARALHAAARAIVERFDGEVPSRVDDLLELPGIGRYTAGAISSIAFGRAAPIVDGNVARVLARLAARDDPPGDPELVGWTWRRAGELAEASDDPGSVNEGLMELGATVCTPRAPRCLFCPLSAACEAWRLGLAEQIPRPKPGQRRPELFCASAVIRDGAGAVLLERRDDAWFEARSDAGSGDRTRLWSGLWQAPTLERSDRPHRLPEVRSGLGLASARRAGAFTHQTTHRLVRFSVFVGQLAGAGVHEPASSGPQRQWVQLDNLDAVGLSSAQRRLIELATSAPGTGV